MFAVSTFGRFPKVHVRPERFIHGKILIEPSLAIDCRFEQLSFHLRDGHA